MIEKDGEVYIKKYYKHLICAFILFVFIFTSNLSVFADNIFDINKQKIALTNSNDFSLALLNQNNNYLAQASNPSSNKIIEKLNIGLGLDPSPSNEQTKKNIVQRLGINNDSSNDYIIDRIGGALNVDLNASKEKIRKEINLVLNLDENTSEASLASQIKNALNIDADPLDPYPTLEECPEPSTNKDDTYNSNNENYRKCLGLTIIAPEKGVNGAIIPISFLGTYMEYIDSVEYYITDPKSGWNYHKGTTKTWGDHFTIFSYSWDTKEAETNSDTENLSHTISARLFHGDNLELTVESDIKILDYDDSTAKQYADGAERIQEHPFFGAILGTKKINNYWSEKIRCDSDCKEGDTIISKALSAVDNEIFKLDDWLDLYYFLNIKVENLWSEIREAGTDDEKVADLYLEYGIVVDVLGQIQERITSHGGVEPGPSLPEDVRGSPVIYGVYQGFEKYKYDLANINPEDLTDYDTFSKKHFDLLEKIKNEAKQYFTEEQVQYYLELKSNTESSPSALFDTEKAYAADPLSAVVFLAFSAWDSLMLGTGRISKTDYAMRMGLNTVALIAPGGFTALGRLGGKVLTNGITRKITLNKILPRIEGWGAKLIGNGAAGKFVSRVPSDIMKRLTLKKVAYDLAIKKFKEKYEGTFLWRAGSYLISKLPFMGAFALARQIVSNLKCEYNAGKTLVKSFNPIRAVIVYVLCEISSWMISAGAFIINLSLNMLNKAAQIGFVPPLAVSGKLAISGTEKTNLFSKKNIVFFSEKAYAAQAKTIVEGIKTDRIKGTWVFALSFVDILIVIVIIMIAFAQILNIPIDSYTVKKALPSLILGIIGANLSYFLIIGLLDLSSVLNVEVLGRIGGKDKMAQDLAGLMGYNHTLEADMILSGSIVTALAAITLTNPITALFILFVFLIIYMVPAFLIFILALLLYSRMYMLYILTIVAPGAFICLGVPQLKNYFQTWWKNLINWIFIAPVIYFLLGLASKFGELAPLVADQKIVGNAESLDLSWLGGWIVGLFLLWAAFYIPLKMLGGPVGSILYNFSQKVGRGTAAMATKGLSNKFNKKRTQTGEDKRELNRLNKKQEDGHALTEQEKKRKTELEGKYIGGEGGLNIMSGFQNLIAAPADYAAAQNASAEYYKRKAADEAVRSPAFGVGADERIRIREKKRVEMDEYKDYDLTAIERQMNPEANGRRLRSIINKNPSYFSGQNWDEIRHQLDADQFEDAWRKYQEKMKDPSLVNDENFNNGHQRMSEVWADEVMGSADKAVRTGQEAGINEDTAIKENVLQQLLLQKARSAYNRSGYILSDMLDPTGARSPRNLRNNRGGGTGGGGTRGGGGGSPYEADAKEMGLTPEATGLPPEDCADISAKLNLHPVLDEDAIDRALKPHQIKLGDNYENTKKKVTAYGQMLQKTQDETLSRLTKDNLGPAIDRINDKINSGIEINPKKASQDIGNAIKSIDATIEIGQPHLKGDPLKQVQKVISDLTPASKVQIDTLATVDPARIRSQLEKYKIIMDSHSGIGNLKMGDIKINPELEQKAKLHIKTKQIERELMNIDRQISYEMKKAGQKINSGLDSFANTITQGLAKPDFLRPLQTHLAHTARSQGLQLGSQAIELATKDFVLGLNETNKKSGYKNDNTLTQTIKSEIIKEQVMEALKKHAKQTQEVPSVYKPQG